MGEVKMGEVMKEFAADANLKPHMKDVASLVPRVLKTLTKLPSERKANVLKIGAQNEKAIVDEAVGFLSERLNAKVSVFSEDDAARYDPKARAGMAMPGQPAIFIE